MKIQTFQDGEFIEERDIEGFTFPPNISQFNTEMLFSPSYMKLIANAGDNDAKTRLELLSVRLELKPLVTSEDLQIFKLIWDTLVSSVPEGVLTLGDAAEYNQLAESNNMPFRFGADLKMEILAV
ncbi:hypothetical protein HUN01_06850 [Nostoc edaphicum CCNP1411]|uniref:Uncharacterized protein n=1 Tax=Nostoc edaphicum CCNP1411 TaxID=1472755 RepID=A0A7D7Q9F7_9NOSO|nr:hypothetical protein [Nostoc edaphicum]QMS87315.1 hypothetical protein HUN01_06850 [Nostoc edaphicum CCNP1411]